MERSHDIETESMLGFSPAIAREEQAFYEPIVRENVMQPGFDQLPAVIYPCKGIEKLIRRDKFSTLVPHVEYVTYLNRSRILFVEGKKAKLLFAILWPNGSDIMMDAWSFEDPSSRAQTQFKVSTFRGTDYVAPDVAGTGVIAAIHIIARETLFLLRTESISEFIHMQRPQSSLVGESFYQQSE